MEKPEIQQKLAEILSKHTSLDTSALAPEKHLRNDLGLDSLDVAELIYEIEEAFGVTIADEAAAKIQKISETVDFIYEQMHTGTASELSPQER